MSYKSKLLAYILVLNLLLIGLAAMLAKTDMKLFMVLELVFIVALVIGLVLFRQFSGTIDQIAAGIESLKDQDFSIKLKPVKNKEFNAFVGVYNKMIDQLRQERIALSEKSFLITKLMEASPSGILIFDFDDRLANLNPAAARFMGFLPEEPVNLSLSELSAKTGGMFDKCATSSNFIFRKSGNEAYRIQNGFFVDRGFDTRFILIEELTHEIYKTEKEAYGKVIRMMSHEINNSMAAVNSVLHTIRPRLESMEGFGQTVDICISRNENLNRFMTNFADVVRIPAPRLKPVDLNRLAENTLNIFSLQYGNKQVRFVLSLSAQPVWIDADEPQMEQVLVNLLKNAFEALESDGVIELITRHNPPELVVRDNGKGIDPDKREKLFTPFYTTKTSGQGIGLTLSREILMNHSCRFELKSDSEKHITEFVIRF